MNDEINKLHAEAKANFSPAQEKLLDGIAETLILLNLSSAEAVPVFEWWIKWERSQQQRG